MTNVKLYLVLLFVIFNKTYFLSLDQCGISYTSLFTTLKLLELLCCQILFTLKDKSSAHCWWEIFHFYGFYKLARQVYYNLMLSSARYSPGTCSEWCLPLNVSCRNSYWGDGPWVGTLSTLSSFYWFIKVSSFRRLIISQCTYCPAASATPSGMFRQYQLVARSFLRSPPFHILLQSDSIMCSQRC